MPLKTFLSFLSVTVVATGLGAGAAMAAQCGNSGQGYAAWLSQFRGQASANGIGKRGLAALEQTRYSQKTINADRNQKSFRYSLERFMELRGATTIAKRGKQRKRSHAQLLASIERQYGVPAGPLLAIWGMETGFGSFLGNEHTLSAVATLAYDCRRSGFFTEQLHAALSLVDRGWLSASARGAMHGEIGQTQFLPANVVRFGVDGDGDGRVDLVGSIPDALASTANFLRAHGWQRGAGYQPGEPNFRAIQGWNAAGVYQQAIAIIGAQIDR